MALKLEVTHKGITCEYWKIVDLSHDFMNDQTRCVLALYMNEDTRQANVLNTLESRLFAFDGILDRDQTYAQIKEPIYEDNMGEQVNINPFVDAEDC